MNTPPKKHPLENGSVLILSTFLILAVTMISVTYWKLIQIRIQLISQKIYSTQAYYAARAGIEDAIYEFRLGNQWHLNDISNDWQQENATTFYKTNINSSALNYFEYPVQFSVNVIGNINNGFVTINSIASISSHTDSTIEYEKKLQATITKSFDNEIIVHTLIEP